MRLGTKLNLILAVVALLGVLFFALLSTPFLQSRAKAEVIERARIMMLSAAGIRHVYEEFNDNHSDIDYRMDVSLPFLYRALRP